MKKFNNFNIEKKWKYEFIRMKKKLEVYVNGEKKFM